jgi:hypothetical protein
VSWFSLGRLVPVKLKDITRHADIPVDVDDQLRLDDYTSSGKQDGEVEIEEEEGVSSLLRPARGKAADISHLGSIN